MHSHQNFVLYSVLFTHQIRIQTAALYQDQYFVTPAHYFLLCRFRPTKTQPYSYCCHPNLIFFDPRCIKWKTPSQKGAFQWTFLLPPPPPQKIPFHTCSSPTTQSTHFPPSLLLFPLKQEKVSQSICSQHERNANVFNVDCIFL